MTRLLTKQDLWLAIFSLDSYQRGYGQQVFTAARSKKYLGNARILDIEIPSDSVDTGFYAIAYDVSGVSGIGASDTVIAYRGTDYDETDGNNFARDIWTGWLIGAGAIGGPAGAASQAGQTIEFYESVVRALDGNLSVCAEIKLSGISGLS